MRKITGSLLAATLLLSACGGGSGSGFNPLGWFGNSREEAAQVQNTNPLIPRRSALRRPEAAYDGVPVQAVLSMSVERVAGGAIIRATGLSNTLGAYDVQLVPTPETKAEGPKKTLEYTLSARYSKRSRPPAPQTSRELVVARFVSNDEVFGVRSIRVISASNARSVRR